MSQSISNMQQVWMSNTNTYNAIAMSVSTLGAGANTHSSLLNLSVDGTTKFKVDANGSVGIGTSNPTQSLTIFGETANVGMSITSNSGGGQMIMNARQGLTGTIGSTNSIGVEFITNNIRRMYIDTNGYITKPNHPMFAAYNQHTATSTVVVNTWGSFNSNFSNWNTPRWDANINVGNNFNASNGIFTAPVAGYYWFTVGMSAQFYNSSYLAFWKNGSYSPPYALTYEYNAAASGQSFYNQMTLNYVFYMAAGDTMTGGCYFASNSWTSYVFNDGYVFISGFLIG